MEFAGLTAGHPCPFGVLNSSSIVIFIVSLWPPSPEICLTPHVSHIWQIDEKRITIGTPALGT